MAKNNHLDILVSIVVPIYNIERYLAKCIDSIRAQSYERIEILLVDDESPDNCPKLCDDYAALDNRIQVIHKTNGGLSDARNSGLHQAKGEYVVFIDGDDYVHRDYIQTLLQEIITQKADISVCNYYRVYEGNVRKIANHADSMTYSNIEAMRDVFTYPSVCEVMTWNKMFKKSLFTENMILFPVGKIHEDNYTTYKLFYFSKKVTYINTPLYYYIQRSGSIMNSGFNRKRLDIIEASNQASEWVNLHKLPLIDEVSAYQLSSTLTVLNSMIDNHGLQDDVWLGIKSWISANKIRLHRNGYVSTKQKLAIIIIGLGKLPYTLLRVAYRVRGTKA
jgi:glycosyltransferase involved in cell wall biosynthesis